MTFTEIVTEVTDRLGLTSSASVARVGRAVNRKYREITASLGVNFSSKRGGASAAITLGASSLSFTAEKIITIHNRNVTPYFQLTEISQDEMNSLRPFATSDFPTMWSLVEARADVVYVDVNAVAATTYNLYADAYLVIADLSGSSEPKFPESFHDILIAAVLGDELLKLEKPQMAAIEDAKFEKRMSELRLWNASSTTKDVFVGKSAFYRPNQWVN